MIYFCTECGEPLIWDEEEIDEEKGIHWECEDYSEPGTEEDEKAVEALVFMVKLEEVGEAHDEAGDTHLAGRTREALDAVAQRYTELYT